MIVPVRMSSPVCVFVRMNIAPAVLVRVAMFVVVHLFHYTPARVSGLVLASPEIRSRTYKPCN